MSYYKSFSQDDLVEYILNTKNELFLSLPALHSEVVMAIKDLLNKPIKDVHVVIDFDAQTFRQGYGDFKSVDSLLHSRAKIKSLKNNRISFVITDDKGYYLFIESRNMVPSNKTTLNAISIDPVSIVRLKKYFFGNDTAGKFEDELTNAIIQESQQLEYASDLLEKHTAPATVITESEIQAAKSDIEMNPPLNPDYQRIVDTYSNKFQYVKLKFDGANIQHRKIRIPSRALPVADAALKARLDTKLNLFDQKKIEKDFLPLNNFKEKLDSIRRKYLKKVKSREESLLEKCRKVHFESEIDELEKELIELQKNLLNQVAEFIDKTKQDLSKELRDFFRPIWQ